MFNDVMLKKAELMKAHEAIIAETIEYAADCVEKIAKDRMTYNGCTAEAYVGAYNEGIDPQFVYKVIDCLVEKRGWPRAYLSRVETSDYIKIHF